MRVLTRLGWYGGLLAAVFAVAFITAGAVVPAETVRDWTAETDDHHAPGADQSAAAHPPAATATAGGGLGLAMAHDGYRLAELTAPVATDQDGALSLTVLGPDDQPVTDFETAHEQELHLIVVRQDGAHFQHVHPARDAAGEWHIPWRWEAAGAYRVFADFVPAATGENLTLSSTLQVAGEVTPDPAAGEAATDTVGGFEIDLDGALTAGGPATLTATVTRDGAPVTDLEPYLGAYGHLVALRQGDLGYLHVHPHHDDHTAAGGHTSDHDHTGGPEIVFEATAPTPGRYLLYLDFQVDGEVHTAHFVVDAP
ncbi:hypothetical protein JQS43_21085 [Natronosporangium hydrolyticum]|uniref:Heavy-metal-associated domain-containing protein n=1 Tax=Natronosporangium hydrolyticum TaxID=2811111 RepID=A0A895YJP6_9ACTN|nr:hypothetical protein [Natronosporangium hydrolyticum]QSB14008.1 hypothetical protein JQS43_21085 [Natronosporangium hydrolyticum]